MSRFVYFKFVWNIRSATGCDGNLSQSVTRYPGNQTNRVFTHLIGPQIGSMARFVRLPQAAGGGVWKLWNSNVNYISLTFPDRNNYNQCNHGETSHIMKYSYALLFTQFLRQGTSQSEYTACSRRWADELFSTIMHRWIYSIVSR